MEAKDIAFQRYRHQGQEVYTLAFEYSEETKDYIKQVLNYLRPTYVSRTGKTTSQAGGWKPELHQWVVAKAIWKGFRAALRKNGYKFISRKLRDEPDPPNIFTDWLEIKVRNKVLLHSTYRDLAELLNPERQTDPRQQQLATQLMARLNSDYSQFRRAKARKPVITRKSRKVGNLDGKLV